MRYFYELDFRVIMIMQLELLIINNDRNSQKFSYQLSPLGISSWRFLLSFILLCCSLNIIYFLHTRIICSEGHCDLQRWGNPAWSILFQSALLDRLPKNNFYNFGQYPWLRCKHPSAPILLPSILQYLYLKLKVANLAILLFLDVNTLQH